LGNQAKKALFIGTKGCQQDWGKFTNFCQHWTEEFLAEETLWGSLIWLERIFTKVVGGLEFFTLVWIWLGLNPLGEGTTFKKGFPKKKEFHISETNKGIHWGVPHISGIL